ncbi:hypothetical protein Back11_12870 [Paenibacillus baekrokdamisoli]|uniref:Uncharacterized protein n=1 Tax=Paenibacillus baekrokdamisoli TaxID=1712516 RepID=A0A3G9INX1_9BACL|nr:hypothetical protein [Paenibacillus baekrokdamisoli]MBB3070591.1 hypothetical protein [Paenibacillus baekrokdamisoli]BBH19942.1 hypothetical protein Back11_12870 [Paenibacillus baekrokdamisoli]
MNQSLPSFRSRRQLALCTGGDMMYNERTSQATKGEIECDGALLLKL